MLSSFEVEFRGPTETRGARWLVRWSGGGRVTVPRNYELDPAEDVIRAATVAAERLGIIVTGQPVAASLPGGRYAVLWITGPR